MFALAYFAGRYFPPAGGLGAALLLCGRLVLAPAVVGGLELAPRLIGASRIEEC